MLLNSGIAEDFRVPWTAKRPNQSILKEIIPEYSLEGLMLKQGSNTLATWWEELTHWERLWCWERLKANGEGSGRGWDGWIALWTQWTWIWANSGRSWGTEEPGMVSMHLQRVGHDLVTEQQQQQQMFTTKDHLWDPERWYWWTCLQGSSGDPLIENKRLDTVREGEGGCCETVAWNIHVTMCRVDQISRSVMSDSLRPHESQHARPPCPSRSPRVCSNSCSLSRWCHPTILSSATLFSSSLESLPTSGSFATSRFFSSGDQSIEASVWWLKESLVVKNRPANAKDPGMTPGLGRSPGGGNSNPLQYSCLGNPTGRGAWGATVHGVTKELDTT